METRKYKFPYTIEPLEPTINAELQQYFHGEHTGYVQVGEEKYFFPQKYADEAEAYYNFEARSDDVWVVTFPRSGTTWTQELVWLVANNLDFNTASKALLTERFPFFEFDVLVHPQLKAELLQENAHDVEKCSFIEKISRPGYEALSNIPTNCRRFIKTHFPFSLLPPSVMEHNCKIIYVARNPKDVAVSYYHLSRLYRTLDYVGNFERYWQYFERNLKPWMPYHSHIKEAVAYRHCPNVLVINYEDMLYDLRASIRRISTFLNSCELTNDGLEKLINHLDITNFRNNGCVNAAEMYAIGILNDGMDGFIRKGGGEHIEFAENPHLLERANNWIAKNHIEI